MTIFNKVDKAFGVFLTWINASTAAMVFLLMLLITADVIARGVFNRPFQGVSEIVSNCIIILCFLEIPYVLMKGTHVRSTIFYDKVGINGKAIIDLIACLLGVFVFSLIIKSSWGGFLKAVAINDAEIAGSVRITTIPGRFSIIFGSTLMIIEFIFLIIKNILLIINPSFALNSSDNIEPEGGYLG